MPAEAQMIIGGKGQHERQKSDFYPTPPECTQALMEFLNLPICTATVWEPACGDGDMVNEIKRLGYTCIGTDVRFGDDFLSSEFTRGDWIITNPPFSLAEQFIRKANEFGHPFAFLLKSQYWHAKSRLELFKEIPPAYILPLTWRPDFMWRIRGKGQPLMDVMWCVWLPHKQSCTQYIPLEKPKSSNKEKPNNH